jgi:hypothetical protein
MGSRVLMNEHAQIVQYLSSIQGPGLYKISEITSHVFLGAWQISEEWGTLKSHGIKAILTLEEQDRDPKVLQRYKKLGIRNLHIRVDDNPRVHIIDHFDATYDFIHSAVSAQQAILVHCQAGVSRSATVIIAYYLRRLYAISFKKSVENTYIMIDLERFLLRGVVEMVKGSRACIKPNAGFVMQLILYELRLKKPYRQQVAMEAMEYGREIMEKRRNEMEESGANEDNYYEAEDREYTMEEYLDEIFRVSHPESRGLEEPHSALLPTDSLDELPELLGAVRLA